jgi:hypothetical protein
MPTINPPDDLLEQIREDECSDLLRRARSLEIDDPADM